MSRLIASIARMMISVSRPTQYDENSMGAISRTRPSATAIASRGLRASIQARRVQREHDHHRREQREVRQLRDERLAEVVDHADNDAADARALEAPHADRKSTRLNSSHLAISYGVFC